MRVFTTFDELDAAAGEELGTSEWLTVDQGRVDAFADATGDHQWIHVDVERAEKGPFGGTIAHGYLTLSLIPLFSSQIFALETPGARLNYGVNKVRFPSPLRVGTRVRATATLAEVTDVPAGKQMLVRWAVEIENGEQARLRRRDGRPAAALIPSGTDAVQDDRGRGVRRSGPATSIPPARAASARSKRSGSSVCKVSSG